MAIDKSVHTILYQKVIARLRTKREERGLTQKQLAGMLGLPQSYVSKIETCERRMDFIELRSICNLMGISVVDFMQEVETEIIPLVEKIESRKIEHDKNTDNITKIIWNSLIVIVKSLMTSNQSKSKVLLSMKLSEV